MRRFRCVCEEEEEEEDEDAIGWRWLWCWGFGHWLGTDRTVERRGCAEKCLGKQLDRSLFRSLGTKTGTGVLVPSQSNWWAYSGIDGPIWILEEPKWASGPRGTLLPVNTVLFWFGLTYSEISSQLSRTISSLQESSVLQKYSIDSLLNDFVGKVLSFLIVRKHV